MDEKQTFQDGFLRGWESVVGPALQPPSIERPPVVAGVSQFMQGLILGIESGKKKIAELT